MLAVTEAVQVHWFVSAFKDFVWMSERIGKHYRMKRKHNAQTKRADTD